MHHYEFYTAWSPPIEFLKKVAVQWPALQFVLAYEEPGMGFKGLAKFQGEVHEDHCISLSNPQPKPTSTTSRMRSKRVRLVHLRKE